MMLPYYNLFVLKSDEYQNLFENTEFEEASLGGTVDMSTKIMSLVHDYIYARDLAFCRTPEEFDLYGVHSCGNLTWVCKFLTKIQVDRCGYPQKNECVMMTKRERVDGPLMDVTQYIKLLVDGTGQRMIQDLINV